MYIITIALLVALLLLLISFSSSFSVSAKADWRWCVANIAKFYIPAPLDQQQQQQAPIQQKASTENNDEEGNGNSNNNNNNLLPPITMMWSEEGRKKCGFKMISMVTLQKEAFFDNNKNDDDGSASTFESTKRHTFIGDSTSLRAYGSAVSEFFPNVGRVDVGKVGQAPPFLSTKSSSSKFGDNNNNKEVEMRFVKMIHVSLWNTTMNYAFDVARQSSEKSSSTNSKRRKDHPLLGSFLNGGLISYSLGNWDLNWKLQPTYKIPGLGKKSLPNVMSYWARNTRAMFEWLDENVFPKSNNNDNNRRLNQQPIIVFKEQLLPNCNASRFEPRKLGKRMYNKRCKELLSPVVIPMYRRVIAAQAWARNIPVIPVDFLVQRKYDQFQQRSTCRMGDGIHLDGDCMFHEQQLIWNVYLLMRKRKISQKLDLESYPLTFKNKLKQWKQPAQQNENNNNNNSTRSVDYYLTADDALGQVDFVVWWCALPWRTEDDPLCANTNVTSAPTGSSSNENDNKNMAEEEDNNNNNNNPPNEHHQNNNEKRNSIGKLVGDEKQNHQKNKDDDYFTKVAAAPGISDIWTVVLILLVPIVAYVGLRTLANSNSISTNGNNKSKENVAMVVELEGREEL